MTVSAPPPTALADSTERIKFKLAVLAYKCLHGTAPSYLEYTADFDLLPQSSLSVNVCRTWLSTVGDRAFTVAAARTWNSLPQTCHVSMFVFRGRLKAFLLRLPSHDSLPQLLPAQ